MSNSVNVGMIVMIDVVAAAVDDPIVISVEAKDADGTTIMILNIPATFLRLKH
jgi:hypothetical protein